jgi:hypothetical protein
VGALAVIWSLWLYRNDKVFNDKNLSLLQIIYRSVYGHLFRGWRIETYLQMSIQHWRRQRGILFPYMGGRIIYEFVHHHLLRRIIIALNDMYFAFLL